MCCSVYNKNSRVQEPRSSSRGGHIYHHTSDPWGDVICPVPATLGSAGLEDCSRGEHLSWVTASVPLNYNLQMLSGHIRLLVPRDNGQGKELLHLKGQVTLTSRKMQLCFYTIVAGKNTHGIQMLVTKPVPPKSIY